MTKDRKFFVRFLPVEERDWQCFKLDQDRKVLYLQCIQNLKRKQSFCGKEITNDKERRYWQFKTDGVFVNLNQKEFFNSVSQDFVQRILEGQNLLYLACGQSGTGKTFSTMGLNETYEAIGVIPRLLSKLLQEIKLMSPYSEINLFLSYLGIDQKNTYDFLTKNISCYKGFKKPLELSVKNEKEGLKLLFEAELKRNKVEICGATILTLRLTGDSQSPFQNSTVHFVDCGGTDIIGKNEKSCQHLITSNIVKNDLVNFAFFAGPDFNRNIDTLSKRYKITRILGKSICNSLVRIVAHIRPLHNDLKMSISTLKFCNLLMGIPNFLQAPPQTESLQQTIENLKRELKEVRGELETRYYFSSHLTDVVCEDQGKIVERVASGYLEGSLSEKAAVAAVHPSLLLGAMKKIFLEVKEKTRSTSKYESGEETYIEGRRKSLGKKSLEDLVLRDDFKSTLIGSKNIKNLKKGSLKRKTSKVRSSIGIDVEESPYQHLNEKGPFDKEKTLQFNSFMISPKNSLQSNHFIIENREKLWNEFLLRNPGTKEEISIFEKDVQEELSKKEKIKEEHLIALGDLELVKEEVESKGWDRLMSVGQKVLTDGRLQLTTKEEELNDKLKKAEEELIRIIQVGHEVQETYKNSNNKLINAKLKAEDAFQDYCLSTYGILLLAENLPEVKRNIAQEGFQENVDTSPLSSYFLHLQQTANCSSIKSTQPAFRV